MQVKTLKLLRMLAQHGDDAAEAMNDILAQVINAHMLADYRGY